MTEWYPVIFSDNNTLMSNIIKHVVLSYYKMHLVKQIVFFKLFITSPRFCGPLIVAYQFVSATGPTCNWTVTIQG